MYSRCVQASQAAAVEHKSRQVLPDNEGSHKEPAPELTGGGGGIGFWWEAGRKRSSSSRFCVAYISGLCTCGSVIAAHRCHLLHAGVVKYLQQRYSSSMATWQMRGASAGALTATLAACRVNVDSAFDSALRLAEEHRLFERSIGLTGTHQIDTCLRQCLAAG